MAHIVNPYNLDDDDDAAFSALLSQGLIGIEDDDDSDESEIKALKSISKGKTRTLNGHTGSVNEIVVSGDSAISASSDKTLRVWNWKTGHPLRTLSGHTASVNDVVVSGDFAISASSDKTLRVWNWKTGHPLRTLDDFTHGISALALDGHYIFAASWGDVQIWNWQTGERLQKQGGWHRSSIIDVAVNGDLLLSVSPDLLLVRNWRTGQNLHKLQVRDGTIDDELENLALDNEFAVFIDYDCIRVWNWKTGEYLDESEPHSESYRSIAHRIFSTSSAVCIYDAETHKWYLHTLDAMDSNAVAFADDYSHIIRGEGSGVVHVAQVASFVQRLLGGKTIAEPRSPNTSHRTAEPTPKYDIEDVLEAARDCIRKRNEKWVNFTRVSQHLHETFVNLNPKTLGRSDKKYTSLLKLIADYPSDFELRQDPQKQGLYWIRLMQTRSSQK